MALEGLWVAAAAGATGSILPDQSGNSRDGTKTAGTTWETIGGEAALRCPASDCADVPHQTVWDNDPFTAIYRGALHTIGGALGLMAHSPGGGVTPKWCISFGHSANALTIHWQTAGATIAGPTVTLSIDTVYVFMVSRNGSAWKFRIYDATGTLISSGTATNGSAFSAATTSLKLGWGAESFFNSDTWLVAARFESAELSNAEMDALALDPFLGGEGGGEPEPPPEADGTIRDLLSEPADGDPEGHVILPASVRDLLSEPASTNVCRRLFVPCP